MTIDYIAVCQNCSSSFDDDAHIPYLFECDHYFCKDCIVTHFSLSGGYAKCPEHDELVCKVSDLKILRDLIPVKTKDTVNKNTCIRDGNTTTHYDEKTGEEMCVKCAFDKTKQDREAKIDNVENKSKAVEQTIQKAVESLEEQIEQLGKKQEANEKEANEVSGEVEEYYNRLIELLEAKKTELLCEIEDKYTANNENILKLSTKIEDKQKKLEEHKRKINVERNAVIVKLIVDDINSLTKEKEFCSLTTIEVDYKIQRERIVEFASTSATLRHKQRSVVIEVRDEVGNRYENNKYDGIQTLESDVGIDYGRDKQEETKKLLNKYLNNDKPYNLDYNDKEKTTVERNIKSEYAYNEDYLGWKEEKQSKKLASLYSVETKDKINNLKRQYNNMSPVNYETAKYNDSNRMRHTGELGRTYSSYASPLSSSVYGVNHIPSPREVRNESSSIRRGFAGQFDNYRSGVSHFYTTENRLSGHKGMCCFCTERSQVDLLNTRSYLKPNVRARYNYQY